MALASGSLQFFGYVLMYGGAAFVCAVATVRAMKIGDEETRRGFVGLLATTGAWAFFELGLLVGPNRATSYALYVASLIIGLATVGAWLYFCSAYTGRSFHRNTTYRRIALAAYLLIVGVKLTNPIHGLYFTARFTATPFPHLAIKHGVVHWIVSGIAYALASVGFFMLYETFLEADYDTRPLAALAAVTGIPMIFDIAGFATTILLDINYEPLGVAVFAVGALSVFKDRFFAVQLTDGLSEPIVHLDSDGRIREYNDRALEQFPELDGTRGQPFADAFPAAAERLHSTDAILERTDDGERTYYLVKSVSATLGQTGIVQSVVFTDVTAAEGRRRELERHNAQLEGFAAAIRHNLLNTLQVVQGRLSHADEALDAGDIEDANESLVAASRASRSMSDTVNDLATLARDGQTVEEVQSVPISRAAEDALIDADSDGIDLVVDDTGSVRANERRLHELLKRGFQFADYNGATTVTVSLREDGFAITDDGSPPGNADVESFFQYGRAPPESDTGMILPNLQMLARTQGWEVGVDTEHQDGFRFVVTGVSVERE